MTGGHSVTYNKRDKWQHCFTNHTHTHTHTGVHTTLHSCEHKIGGNRPPPSTSSVPLPDVKVLIIYQHPRLTSLITNNNPLTKLTPLWCNTYTFHSYQHRLHMHSLHIFHYYVKLRHGILITFAPLLPIVPVSSNTLKLHQLLFF